LYCGNRNTLEGRGQGGRLSDTDYLKILGRSSAECELILTERVRMPQPVWRRSLQLVGEHGMVGLDGVGSGPEEPAQHLPQARCGDAAGFIEMAEQRRIQCPACGTHRQTALHQVLVQRKAREWREYDPGTVVPHLVSVRSPLAYQTLNVANGSAPCS